MDRAVAARLAGWLERPDVTGIDAPDVEALRAALGEPDPPMTVGRWGTVVGYAPGPRRRRLVQFDRRGTLIQALYWTPSGELVRAMCVTSRGDRIGVEPGAGTRAAWGASDRLWRLAADGPWNPVEPITEFQALDYGRLDAIPPLAAPARLPPGAGTAVLNLIAGLMKDQGAARVRYRGPYPTEQLFTALLESFRYDPSADDPLGRFMDGGALDWTPAPHELHHVAPGVAVQLRHAVERVALDGADFYRADWQGVLRREPRVVREVGERVVCALSAFGRSIEERLVLDRAGEVLERPEAAVESSAPSPLAPLWSEPIAELISRESAPALAPAIRAVVETLALEWGPVPGDFIRIHEGTVRLSRRLRDVGVSWVREAEAPERGQRAIAFVLEIARLIAPTARVRAQERLAALDADGQRRALETPETTEELPQSVGKLLALVASGRA